MHIWSGIRSRWLRRFKRQFQLLRRVHLLPAENHYAYVQILGGGHSLKMKFALHPPCISGGKEAIPETDTPISQI